MSCLSITELPAAERANIIDMPRVVPNRDPATIRSQIGAGCKRLGLTEEQRTRCENAGLGVYWKDARSVGWCVSVGMKLARQLSGKYRVPVRGPEPPEAA